MSHSHTAATQLCRICHNGCPILVEVEDDRVVGVRGDRESPLHRGYLCPKGMSLPALHNDPRRLLHPLKRDASGELVPIALERALDEIADRLAGLLEEDGPRSAMGYAATGIQPQVALSAVLAAFLRSIESPWPAISAASIDQAGKETAQALHGTWQAPPQGFDDPEALLLVGLNPLVSHLGVPQGSPMRWLRERKSAGMKLLVIDPRKSETARHADLHLQPRPGEDVAILAAMLRVVLSESLYDASFVAAHTTGIEALGQAVDAYTLDRVAARADIDASELAETARSFAGAGRGFAFAGTGANMAGHATLTEYMILCLNTVCGRWMRAGEVVRCAPTLLRPAPFRAQATAPTPHASRGPALRVPGRVRAPGSLQIMDLVDEMLLEGAGRIRALFVAGGNPVAAWPDQERTIRGLRALDLLVVVDPVLTTTARLADYVIPPKLLLEVVSATTMQDYFGTMNYATGYVDSFAQYVDAAVAPPAGSDLIEEWEFFYEVARRLGRSLRIAGTELPSNRRPTTRELLEIMTRGARISLAEVERHPHGAFFMDESIRVEAASADAAERLELASPPMLEELSTLADPSNGNVPDERFPFRMIARRMRHVQNSMLHGVVAGQTSDNPAYMNPDDATRLGIEAGDRIAICSTAGEIEARTAIDPSLRPGLVSISHGFGGLPGDGKESRHPGSNTGLLIDVDYHYDPFTGQPRMSDVPVGVRPLTCRDYS